MTTSTKQTGRPLTHKPSPRKAVKTASWDTMPMEAKRTVSEATLAANRARIEAQQARRVKPVTIATGAAPAWLGPFKPGKVSE